MRRLSAALALSVILTFILPMPASAFWRWLDELSGPGPFDGVFLEVRAYCFMDDPEEKQPDKDKKDEETAQTGTDPKKPKEPTPEEKIEMEYLTALGAGGFTIPCLNKVRLNQRRFASINLSGTLQWAERVNLQYDGDPNVRRWVTMLGLGPSFWIRPTRSFEVGSGMGIYLFWTRSSDGSHEKAFGRFGVEPLIFDLKPLAALRDIFRPRSVTGLPDTQLDLILSVRASVLVFPHGFTAENFGARPGTFAVSVDKLRSLSVQLDLEPFVRYCKVRSLRNKKLQRLQELQKAKTS